MLDKRFEYKLWRENGTTYFQVLKQPEEMRERGIIYTAKNGIAICSGDSPEIYQYICEIFIRGQERNEDCFIVSLRCTEEQYNRIYNALEEFSEWANKSAQIKPKQEKRFTYSLGRWEGTTTLIIHKMPEVKYYRTLYQSSNGWVIKNARYTDIFKNEKMIWLYVDEAVTDKNVAIRVCSEKQHEQIKSALSEFAEWVNTHEQPTT